MDLTSPKIIKELLATYGAVPNKVMGQNFLINKNALAKVINAAELKKTDTVLEIGPGIGVLTQELAQRTKKVIAIEKDRQMIEILAKTLKDFKNIEIISGDILKLDPRPYTLDPIYKVVANIPYYLTSPLIRKLLESENPPTEIILMVQKEVAQRICAKPPNMSILAVSVQFYATPKIISYISKGCFLPVPKVDSAIIKIVPFKARGGQTPARFFEVVKAGFSQPRKQLAGNLAKSFNPSSRAELTTGQKKDKIVKWLLKNNIQPEQRAETLSVQDWEGLTMTCDLL